MKKIICIVTLSMLTFLGAYAQEYNKAYFDAVTNIRIGYAGALTSSDTHLSGGLDLGVNILEFGVRPYETGAIRLGVDFMLDNFYATDGYHFSTLAHKTSLVPALLGANVKSSHVNILAFGAPLNFTQTFNDKLKLTIGATAKINLNAETYYRYETSAGDYTSINVTGVNTRRFSYDIHVAVDYNDFGIYASYSPMKVFESGNGPDFGFFSVGAIFRNSSF